MKIIYLVESKFSKRDHDRFGVKALSKRGYNDIEVWDFSAWFRPEYFKKYTLTVQAPIDNYKSISSKETVIELLESLTYDCIFICLFSPSIKSIVIFNYLNKNQYKYGFISFGYFLSRNKLSMIRQILDTPFYILKKLVNVTALRIYFLATLTSIKASFVILGGGVATSKYIGDETTLLKTHTLDYDNFLDLKHVSKEKHEKYIVYFDDCGPFHPDDIDRGIVTDASRYYKMLNSFLDQVEFQLGMRVVIAPHPRSDYENIGNPFNGRVISKRPTIEVVRDSSVVINYGSTATSFAVLYKKPMIFMVNSLYPSYTWESIKFFAGFFNKDPIDNSESNFVIRDSDLLVDHDAYNSYKELYIKESGTPEKSTWDVFADYLDTFK